MLMMCYIMHVGTVALQWQLRSIFAQCTYVCMRMAVLLVITVLSVIYAGKIFMLIHHFEPNFIFTK